MNLSLGLDHGSLELVSLDLVRSLVLDDVSFSNSCPAFFTRRRLM